ncbi:MAG: 4-(cytidine 5'-diphospho)-2-C-methyl-D-erythritol kinase [Actinomycetota bacterium]
MSALQAREVRELARAKINLFLRVGERREDGFHEMESLIAPTSLADELIATEADGITLEIDPSPGREETPAGPDNLAVVAALALAEVAAPSRGVAIELVKNIPVAGGLGGGSADAAAVLLALNDLWDCGLSPGALDELAATIGSDVPALLQDGASLVRGRGELVEPIEIEQMIWVIVPFDFRVLTPEVFGWWDEDAPASTGNPSAVIAAARSGDIAGLGAAMFNDLEGPVTARHPEIAATRERVLDAGALGAIMCGSGPSVAALTAGMDAAFEVMRAVPEGGIAVAPALRSEIQWDDPDDGAL